MTRRAIFDAVRTALGRGLTQPEVDKIDELLDTLGIPRDSHGQRAINSAGLDIIRDFEGLRLTAYRDPVGILTIGYGHTGPDVFAGKSITQAEAESILKADLARFEKAVSGLAPKATDNQFSAMVSLAFNIGEGAFGKSTLLKLHNAGDYAGAQKQFSRWVHAGGKRLKGLERRREAEAKLYGTA